MSKIVMFEQAKRLKELGFDEETYKEYRTPVVRVFESGKAKYIEREPDVYDTGRHASFYGDVSYENYISAPTVSEALDWVREEKGIECGVYPIMIPIRDGLRRMAYAHSAFDLNNNCKRLQLDISLVKIDTHHLASSALLDAVLTYLEQKEKK